MTVGVKKMVSIRGQGHALCITEAIAQCWGKESFTDVEFVCKNGKKRLPANKAVLAASSNNWASLLAGTEGDDLTTIIVPETDFAAMEMFLKYIYSGEVVASHLIDDLKSLISKWVILFYTQKYMHCQYLQQMCILLITFQELAAPVVTTLTHGIVPSNTVRNSAAATTKNQPKNIQKVTSISEPTAPTVAAKKLTSEAEGMNLK